MQSFQLVSLVALAAAVAACPVHYLLMARRQPHPGLGECRVRRYNAWERLVHLALLASFLVLAWTGFYAAIGWGGPMKGYMLMVHTTAGAVFAVSVGAMLLTWAADHAFARGDGRWLAQCGCAAGDKAPPAGRFDAGEKAYFWIAGLTTLVALLSMLLSMVPLLDTAGQRLMYQVHRYDTLILVVATIWHAYTTTLAKPGTWRSLVSGRVSSAWIQRYHPLWGKGAQPPARI
jgi:formate dehydrogenase subunit gamma